MFRLAPAIIALLGVAALGLWVLPGPPLRSAETEPGPPPEGLLHYDPSPDRPGDEAVLFTDPPGHPEARTALVGDFRAASPEERAALVSVLKACIAYDLETHVNKRPADVYYIGCKRTIDSWRLAHGRASPKRQIDREIAVFLRLIRWVKVSAQRIDQEKCGRFGACSQEARDLFTMTNPADLARLGAESLPHFRRTQLFVEGLIEIVQETR